MSYLRFLCLFTYRCVKYILCFVFVLFFFVMCIMLNVASVSGFSIRRFSLTYILLVTETRKSRRNHPPVASHLQSSSHKVVSSAPRDILESNN